MPEPTLTLSDRIKARFGEQALSVVEARGETTLEVPAAAFRDVALALRDDADFRFECLIDLCGVDYLSYGEDEWDTADVSSEGFSRGVEGQGAGRFTWEDRPRGKGPERRFAAVVHLLSITHNRRVRLEATTPDADRHIPSLVGVYPACNWHERETWDLFGIIFDGHPALTRIQMPDDWKGHPQRKDYPLGGIPVEYRGAKIPAPDERRHYS